MTWLEFQLKIISFIDVDYSPTEIEKTEYIRMSYMLEHEW